MATRELTVMRRRVKEMYNSDTWHKKVDNMPGQQVYAIYHSAIKPGGRLDETKRYYLMNAARTEEDRAYLESLPMWRINDIYNEAVERLTSIPVIEPTYHQVTFFELGVDING